MFRGLNNSSRVKGFSKMKKFFSTNNTEYDVCIIGGGPAGKSRLIGQVTLLQSSLGKRV